MTTHHLKLKELDEKFIRELQTEYNDGDAELLI